MQRRGALKHRVTDILLITCAHSQGKHFHAVVVDLILLAHNCQLGVPSRLIKSLRLWRVSIIDTSDAMSPSTFKDTLSLAKELLLLFEFIVLIHFFAHLFYFIALV